MTTFNATSGVFYDCEAKKQFLDTQKRNIEYHSKNLGNPLKSSITPTQLTKMQEQYDIEKAKYDSSECVQDRDKNKCLTYQFQLESLRSNVIYSIGVRDMKAVESLKLQLDNLMKEYKDLKCDAKISQFRGDVVMSIAEIYQKMDKERIEAESKYQFKQRLFFGGLVVLGALIMVTTLGKNK